MKLMIRRAIKNDAVSLADVLTSSWKSAYKDIIPAIELEQQTNFVQRKQMFEKMLEHPIGEFYIATDNAIPCGQFMFCKSRDSDLSEYAEIVSIYVIENYWHKGVGTAMMKTALLRIADLGYKNTFLWVFKDNKRARRFYEKFGFVLDGIEKESEFSNRAIEVRYILKNSL